MITIEKLTKYYGSNRAVNNISFTINDNEILGFLGPNGAGKSTTMNMIAGYLPMSAGKVTILGSDISKEPVAAKKNIGYLPEIPPVYPDMRVKEYLSFCAGLKRIRYSERKDEISRVMGLLKIEDVKDKLIKNLSKGAKVIVGQSEVKVDLALMMSYGFNIPATCQQAQTRVKASVENMTGLEVTDVNIRIAGITMPKA